MEQHATAVAQPDPQLLSKPVHAIRYLHGAHALRSTLAETHGASRAVAATSLLTSLLLTCDAMPGVMNRLRRGGWVKFWTSQIVALSGQSESTQRRARSILRDAGVLEERRLTSGEIAMQIDLKKLLAATPSVVGAPDDDVTVQEPTPKRKVAAKAAVNMTDIRPYGAPELQTLSTTGTGTPTRMREAVGEPDALTNDLEFSERIDSGTEGPTTSVEVSTGDANAIPVEPGPEPLSASDRELVSDVFLAFSKHPSIARSAKTNPLRTPAAQATAQRVAAMVREGVPAGALASATTQHLDAMYRQTGAVVWSPTYCEPAYDRLHSEWTMRRAQQLRLRKQQTVRSALRAKMSAEVVDDAVVDEVMTKYRRTRPTPLPTPATGGDDLRREIDALVVTKASEEDR
ncbi:hypothetical protein HN371_30415 [Candidatus Poribacteria bacterium]|jgi:hypothetical protein|nr:hypothetical protein [Candidatus Poribacteria bacterium]MBT7808464.1 hypothetical protein [Candidatus Poribacteria bacterium]